MAQRQCLVQTTPTASARAPAALTLLALLAIVAALYLARAFIIPLLIGILTSYALSPAVDWLCRWRVPRVVAAALVLAALAGGFSWMAFSLGDEATAMARTLPEAARQLRQGLSERRAPGPTALHNVQQAAKEMEQAAADIAAPAKPARAARAPSAPAPVPWLNDFVLAQTRLLAVVLAQAPIVVLLAYFLLAAGEHFRRKLLLLVGPSLAAKKDAVRVLEEIDEQIRRFLFSTIISNVLLAIATWLAFAALGVESALVWGVAAGVLHFIPYLGPLAVALASGLAAYLQFDSLLSGLAVAGASLAVAAVVGLLFTTWLQGRFAHVNPAVLFIALLFFGWLWGIWGLLLGAPLVAIAKVVCDRVESLRPGAVLLGR